MVNAWVSNGRMGGHMVNAWVSNVRMGKPIALCIMNGRTLALPASSRHHRPSSRRPVRCHARRTTLQLPYTPAPRGVEGEGVCLVVVLRVRG